METGAAEPGMPSPGRTGAAAEEARRAGGGGSAGRHEEEEPPMAGEAAAAEERLALAFQRGFLAGRRLPDLPWEDLEQKLKSSSDSSSLLAILQKTVLHPLCLKFPPSVKYRKCFLTELIKKLEPAASEPLDELYEALGNVLRAEETPHCYKNYLLPTGDAITLCESVAIISQGTTGLVTWDAGLCLAEWALENEAVFRNRSVLELGSGIGLTGLAICKACCPRAYTFSDHHQLVLQQLSENVSLNGFVLDAAKGTRGAAERYGLQGPNISIAELDWNSVTKEQLAEFRADVVLAADVVYDPQLIQALTGVLQKLSGCSDDGDSPEVYIAFAIRNPDTYHLFQLELDKVGIRWQPLPGPQKNLFPYDPQANITLLKLHL